MKPSATIRNPAAFGLYPSTRSLYLGAEALRAARFKQTDISVMYSDGARAVMLRENELADVDDDECGSLGEMLSGLSGVGAIDTPNDGPYLVAGPLLASLVHTEDGLVSSLREIGVPEASVACFEVRMKEGSLLLSVQCEDREWANRAQQILQETGAEHVAASASAVSLV